MVKSYQAQEFYPTPRELLEEITRDVHWGRITSMLEPSAGKGDIVEFVREKRGNVSSRELDIDCIEIDPDLQNTLKGKEIRLVHDDFLTYHTFKHYDLIFMNPPFSNGAAHLLKALDMQKNGGEVICILNAETLKNPCTNERKVLRNRLLELSADITYMANAFSSAENRTDVEIAVIKVHIEPQEMESHIFEEMKKKYYAEPEDSEETDLVTPDYIRAAVLSYNLEIESGVQLLREYAALQPKLMEDLKETPYSKPIIQLSVNGALYEGKGSVNRYVRAVRRKYWTALFKDRPFTGKMTSYMYDEYTSKVDEFSDYDFSYFNIKTMQEEMSRDLIRGIEDCIVELFDKLSYQYHYSNEFCNNIHYYNGWKTNKAWYINKKVILPVNGYDQTWNKFRPTKYDTLEKLSDIEKALNYLDGGFSNGLDITYTLEQAEKEGQTRKIQCKYFTLTFYKKGTCHIEFLNEDLLKKLNIFGSQQKRWLPPAYGMKSYEEMSDEERAVVDDFEGRDSYEDTMARRKEFIYDPTSTLKMLSAEG